MRGYERLWGDMREYEGLWGAMSWFNVMIFCFFFLFCSFLFLLQWFQQCKANTQRAFFLLQSGLWSKSTFAVPCVQCPLSRHWFLFLFAYNLCPAFIITTHRALPFFKATHTWCPFLQRHHLMALFQSHYHHHHLMAVAAVAPEASSVHHHLAREICNEQHEIAEKTWPCQMMKGGCICSAGRYGVGS